VLCSRITPETTKIEAGRLSLFARASAFRVSIFDIAAQSSGKGSSEPAFSYRNLFSGRCPNPDNSPNLSRV
jgi:hypothetical protein